MSAFQFEKNRLRNKIDHSFQKANKCDYLYYRKEMQTKI